MSKDTIETRVKVLEKTIPQFFESIRDDVHALRKGFEEMKGGYVRIDVFTAKMETQNNTIQELANKVEFLYRIVWSIVGTILVTILGSLLTLVIK